MPFTDPMADGPAIQRANLRSLGAGTTTRDLLDIARDFRERHPSVPLVLMGYANPMLARGADWFAREAAAAGVDGVICVDVPPEEDDALGPALRRQGVDLIRLATPTTDAARLFSVHLDPEFFGRPRVAVAFDVCEKRQGEMSNGLESHIRARSRAFADLFGRRAFLFALPGTASGLNVSWVGAWGLLEREARVR